MDLAVRWVLDTPGITSALWGARHPAELEAVAGVLGWNLDADTRSVIDRVLRQTIADPIGPEFMAPPEGKSVAALVRGSTRRERSRSTEGQVVSAILVISSSPCFNRA
jgi:hypothetical protein